jgi:hypothetical protein
MRRIIAGAVFGLSLMCGTALAEGAAGGSTKTPLEVADEIIVLGKSWGEIRAQIQRAEEAVYDRFNEINSNDEFDIHCYREAPIGTRILQRLCESNAWRTAVAKMGEEFVRSMQGGFAAPTAVFLAEGQTKNRLLAEEMKQLAVQDPVLRQNLWRLGNLEQGMRDLLRSGTRPGATAGAQQTAAEGALPYDAALAADVRIGRKAWTHPLTHRTFTFAHVFGEIEQIAVACRGEQGQLQYEAGSEWTLPADWRSCTLRADAPNGTTFTLYEFE